MSPLSHFSIATSRSTDSSSYAPRGIASARPAQPSTFLRAVQLPSTRPRRRIVAPTAVRVLDAPVPAPSLVLVILAVRDLPRSRAFYTAAFDWAVTVDQPVYVELRMPNGQRLGLYARDGFARSTGELPAASPPGATAPTELYLHTTTLAPDLARLEAAGARLLSPLAPRDWGDDAAYYADPDGNVLVLATSSAHAVDA